GPLVRTLRGSGGVYLAAAASYSHFHQPAGGHLPGKRCPFRLPDVRRLVPLVAGPRCGWLCTGRALGQAPALVPPRLDTDRHGPCCRLCLAHLAPRAGTLAAARV